MIQHSRTNPYTTRYGSSTDDKKKKAYGLSNGPETTEPFGKRNSTLIFDGKER
jgi:hypothetical protein